MDTALATSHDWPGTSWALTDIVTATGARPAGAPVATACGPVCTDSRRVPAAALFIALRGPHFDGHAFVAEALRKGAALALAERVPADVDPARVLLVSDTLRALGDLAAWVRRRTAVRVVGITGSNGKTTTKEMVAAVCERAPFPPPRTRVLKTAANENNLIGVPMTLLRLAGDEAVAVLEMGMNAFGEIARLTEIASPDVGVITNIGPAHLEGLGSIDGVAQAKGELFAGMRPDAVIAVNLDDARVVRAAAGFAGRRVGFGRGGEVEARAVRDLGFDGIGFDLCVGDRAAPVRLRMPGSHNVANALAAAAVAHALGIDLACIAAGLESAPAPAMRMQVVRLANGVTVLNDGYNANPASMEAALRAITRPPARAIAVLGEMRELGADSPVLHRELGRFAAQCGVAVLVAVGPHADEQVRGAVEEGMSAAAAHACPDPAAAAALVTRVWRTGDAVLVKGSRGPDTEEVVRLRGSRMAEIVRLLEAAGGGRA